MGQGSQDEQAALAGLQAVVPLITAFIANVGPAQAAAVAAAQADDDATAETNSATITAAVTALQAAMPTASNPTPPAAAVDAARAAVAKMAK